MRLEDLQPGQWVKGILPDGPVHLVNLDPVFDERRHTVYRTRTGELGETTLQRADEPRLALEEPFKPASFTASGAELRLASEAERLRLAHVFDPFFAVNSSRIQPLPHQIQAVYGCMLPRQPLRFLLADDPGAGKTIMAGLFIKELMNRADLERCLIIAPGGLVDNWRAELLEKFDLDFKILTNEMLAEGNAFERHDLLIAKVHHVAWREDIMQQLRESTDFDLVIVDEAHKMSAHYSAEKIETTLLYDLGKLAGTKARHFLMMTATPHSGYHETFELFLQLVDPDRFEGRPRGDAPPDTRDIMRRMIKEDLVKMDGTPLFPPREAMTTPFRLSPEEMALYEAVTSYVKSEMNRADRSMDPSKKNIIGFALTILQRRLASSPHAIYESLRRRRERLEGTLQDLDRDGADLVLAGSQSLRDLEERLEAYYEDPDSLSAEDEQREGDQAISAATASRTKGELRAEVERLRELEAMAKAVVLSGNDSKWKELARFLDDPVMHDEDGTPRKIIIFTEHAATLDYLRDKIGTRFGDTDAVLVIHGGVGREARLTIKDKFWHDPKSRVLIGTDAAGEGINLQCANIVLNYDLPWNPNRLEQRFGRVHRIGQERRCYMVNLVATDTREGMVFQRLMEKLENEFSALGGKVFDVLGQAFEGKPLRDILLRAIREEDDVPTDVIRDDIEQIAQEVQDLLLEEQTWKELGLTKEEEKALAEELARAQTRKLQPFFVRSFFEAAFERLGGKMFQRAPGRYEIVRVPPRLRAWRGPRGTARILERYERVTFERERVEDQNDGNDALLLSPDHHLVQAVIDLTLQDLGHRLEEGAVLVDRQDPGTQPRMLMYLEDTLLEGRKGPHGEPRIASRRYHFLEYDGKDWREAAHAPYLEYEPLENLVPDEATRRKLGESLDLEWAKRAWTHDVGPRASRLQAEHAQAIRDHRVARAERIKRLVTERLDAEMSRFSVRMLKFQGSDDPLAKANFATAKLEHTRLSARKTRRLRELDEEATILSRPPRLAGHAIILPWGLVEPLVQARPADEEETRPEDTSISELAAMQEVIRIETALGNRVEDVHKRRGLGYDLESWTPDNRLRPIEVKARHPGANSFTVTVNEIRAALNDPENFILALVEVADGKPQAVRYTKRPWDKDVPFAYTRIDCLWKDAWDRGTEPA